MKKGIIPIVIVAATAIVVCHIVPQWSPKQWMHTEPLRIDKTGYIINQIKKEAELITACYYEEIVLHESKVSTNLLIKHRDHIVIIAKGEVRAGIDLSKIGEEDIVEKGDTLRLTIPHAQIQDVIVNPSGIDIFDQKGEWSQSEVTHIVTKAQRRLAQHARNTGIIEQADSIGIRTLQDLMQTIGYAKVEIAWR